MRRRFGFGVLLGILLQIPGLSACSRDDVGVGITVVVIDRTSGSDPFGPSLANEDGETGMRVFLVKDGASPDTLTKVKEQWLVQRTNAKGIAKFPSVHGVYHVLVDANHDGAIDAKALQVPSGSSRTIILGATGDDPNSLQTILDRKQYAYGQRVRFAVTGILVENSELQVEVWRDTEPERELLLTLKADAFFSGEVNHQGDFAIDKSWPPTKASQFDDFLVVPKVGDRYFPGARFSLRKAVPSKLLSNLQLAINDGAPFTDSRGVLLTVSATHAARVAFSEDPATFAADPAKLLFSNGQAFNYSLSMPDGAKTVWAMFYDVDDNYAGPISDSILLNTAPAAITGAAVVINAGDPMTRVDDVRVTVSAYNAARVSLSLDPADFPDGQAKFLFSSGQAFDMILPPPDGNKTVWAMFFDADDNFAAPVSATIRLDTSPDPVSGYTFTINEGEPFTFTNAVTLTVGAGNAARVAFSENPFDFPHGKPKYLFADGDQFDFVLRAPDGLKTVWAMFYDADGNYSSPVSATITLDTSPDPVSGVSFTINQGALTTNANAVTLTVAAGNATFVSFSENPDDFPDGRPKLIVADGDTFDYQLRDPDGVKTIWAMFFGMSGNYADPISASILFDTMPPAVTGVTFTINYGAPVTMYPVVMLQADAYHADYVYFADEVTRLTTAIPFALTDRDYAYALLTGNGPKTVWAMFADQTQRSFSDPVSATIRLQEGYPEPVSEMLLYVLAKPPGQTDYVGGITGAAGPGDPIAIYADQYETRLLAQGFAMEDGSFGPWEIGDGSIGGNVEKPTDYVFVVTTDSFGRHSAPTPITNDSTPPATRGEDIHGIWTFDPLGNGVGNRGDVFRGYYLIPGDFPPVADAVGGFADFRNLGGPANVSATPIAPANIAAAFTIPATANIDRDYTHFRMRLYDAAGNLSGWVSAVDYFFVDTIPPREVDILAHEGGNHKASVTWYDPNYDSQGGYVGTFTDQDGNATVIPVELLAFCDATNYSGRSCQWYGSYLFGGTLPDGIGGDPVPYWFTGLHNCRWYDVTIQAVDNGGNIGPYSAPFSDRVILPAPDFQAWGSFSSGGAGSLIYAAYEVTDASSYELHFGLTPGDPYVHTTTSGQASPLGFTIPVSPYVARLSGLPLRTNLYLSSRAVDAYTPDCKSDYAPEMTVATDLRLQSIQDGTGGETIGGALAAITDVTGDNLIDLLTVATTADYVVTVDTNTGQRFDTFGIFRGAVAYDFPGTPLVAADVDGDGEEEYIVGSPSDTYGGRILAGSVRIYDHDHSLMTTLGMAVTGLQFGFSVANLGDLDGEPGDEFAVGGFGCAHRECGYSHYSGTASEGPGRVQIYTYKFGAFLPLFGPMVGPLKGDYFGAAIAGGSNVITTSTEPDFAIGIPGSPYIPSMGVALFDGASGQPVVWIQPKNLRFGSALAFIRDIDADGIDDLIVGSPGRGTYGEVYAISSRDWETVIWQQTGRLTFSGSGFASVIATGGDVNNDGQDDVVVGAPPSIQAYYYGYGSAYVLDGRTGRFLYELRGSSTDGAIGYSVLLPGNVNAGPGDEWVVGAPGTAQSAYQAGRLYILSTDP